MKVIVVEDDEMDNRANHIVLSNRINPASISRIVEKRMNDKVKNVCIVFTNGDELNLSPEAWAERKIVDDPDLDSTSSAASRTDGVIDAHNTIPSASCCRIALRGIIAVIDSGTIPQPGREADSAYRTLVESHNRILELIKSQAEDALEHAGGKK